MRYVLLLSLFTITILLSGCYPYYEEDLGIGGSKEQLPRNGGFELTADGVIPDSWTQTITGDPEFYYFSLDGEQFKQGNNGLKITFFEALSNPDPVQGAWGGLYQKISVSDWDVSTTYRLQYWYKVEIGNFQIRILKNGSFNTPLLSQVCGPTNTWLFSEIPFNIDSETEFIEIWIVTKTALANNGLVRGWLDDMKILK
jgi:hypothetical protein